MEEEDEAGKDMQACSRVDCGEAEDREWRTAAEECKGKRSASGVTGQSEPRRGEAGLPMAVRELL